VASGVDVLIQTGVINLAAAVGSGVDILGTPVDISKSFIQYRGMNALASTIFPSASPFSSIQMWRNRWFFSGIAGGLASSVTVERPASAATVSCDFYYTVVAFLGAGGTSADIRIERGNFTVSPPTPSGAFTLPLPQLTTAELARAFCFCRGVEVDELTGDAGTGDPPSEQPERWHGSFRLVNRFFPLPPVTRVEYSLFTLGFPGGANHCGNVEDEVYVTVVVFP
jgi:hypothetical protein